jgi:hypothetical protein
MLDDMSTGAGAGDPWSLLFGAMKEIRASWPSYGWSWDARVSCVTSSFSVELEGKARSVAAIALSSEWTSATIQQAPAHLREIAERAGGLRAGQLVLSSAPVGNLFAYGLWWPWGDGMTTSVRIGLGGPGARQEVLQRLRDVFGVEV